MPAGRPPKKYDEKDARQVQTMAKYGVPLEQIASSLGMCFVTFAKLYSDEAEKGKALANTKVGETLFKMATSGTCPTATIFWAKTKMGFKDTQKIDLSSEDGTMSPTEIKISYVDPNQN